eukprot:TRINITY_DN8828_c0_g1_i2.p1 TRINITY_DN8828_c0_g1~~TRINITY_DN8828_c0_g1_i2.p1  ORF type:complete len:460 (+),score=80.43 TRINITY_DN8828_c0_g1_i2:144-1523(+)
MKKIFYVLAAVLSVLFLVSPWPNGTPLFESFASLYHGTTNVERKVIVSISNEAQIPLERMAVGREHPHNMQSLNLPTSAVLSLNRTLRSTTISNCCIMRDSVYYFNTTKDIILAAQRMSGTAYFFAYPGHESIWRKAVHINGSTLVLLGNHQGNNNLQHMWFGRQFPTLARGLQQHLTGDAIPYFENIIVDGSTYTHSPAEWHRGLNQAIIDLINERNQARGEPVLKVYEADERHPICFQTATFQGNGNDMRKVVIGGKEPTLEILHKLRSKIYASNNVTSPTPKRCPRKVVIYAKLDSGHKRWLDAGEFYEKFKATYPDFDVDYWPMFPKMTFGQQVRVFSNLDLLISSDGAHQMPVLFMSSGSAAIETLDGTGWFRPWNLVFGLHEFVNVHFLALKGIKVTTEVYDKYAKEFDPQDLQAHRHMAGAHTVDMKETMKKVAEMIDKMRKDCVPVPKDRY